MILTIILFVVAASLFTGLNRLRNVAIKRMANLTNAKKVLSNNKIDWLVFTAPGATGKDFLVDLVQREMSIKRLVSYTSRPPRENEIDGVDYYFRSVSFMESLRDEGAFLEFNTFKSDWHYGRLKTQMQPEPGAFARLLILDPVGLSNMFNEGHLTKDNCIVTTIRLPDEVILNRLQARGNANDDPIRRWQADKKDFSVLDKNLIDITLTNPEFTLKEWYSKVRIYLRNQ